MHSIQHVGSTIQRIYAADGLTIACQDGQAAGQSVPHVHFHILPRKSSGVGEDPFEGEKNDQVYPALEENEAGLGSAFSRAGLGAGLGLGFGAGVGVEKEKEKETRTPPTFLKVDADQDRKPRSLEEMEQEAKWLKAFFPSSSEEST